MKKCLIFCLISMAVCFAVPPSTHLLPNGGKIWALLVAGSSGYGNYRHQADICHAYQILHRNGIPDEQIIVMMVDDIATNEDNPTPGKIINVPGGPDVYKGVLKDYTGNDVDPTIFLNVLSGNASAVAGIGSERVINSGPNDNIFVNFVDHGAPGYLAFPNDSLHADDLITTLLSMKEKRRFNKMVLYIEACYSGSMFDNILQDDLDIFVTTAADPFESSFACFWDEARQTYLADVFSSAWLNQSVNEAGNADLNHIFEQVRTATNTSHVEEYGDLDIGETKLREVIGFKMSGKTQQSISIADNDVVDNIDVPLMTLVKRHKSEKNSTKKAELKRKIFKFEKIYKSIDAIFHDLISTVVKDPERKSKIAITKKRLGYRNFPCYKQVLNEFSSKCLNLLQNPYARKHLYKLVNMCAAPEISTGNIIQGISRMCKGQRKFTY